MEPHCKRSVGVCLLYFCSCILLSRNRFFLHDALMVFLAPKCQAKVHETTRKLKSKDYALQYSFTWTWRLNLSSSFSTKYNYTKEIRIVVYSSSEETTAKRSCLINVFPPTHLTFFCITKKAFSTNSGSKQERTEKCQTNSSSSFKIASSGRAASYKKVYSR